MTDPHCLRIPSDLKQDTIAVAAEVVQECWPDAVFQNAVTGDLSYYPSSCAALDEEILVYRDINVAKAWNRGVAGETERKAMLQLVPAANALLVTTENVSSPELSGVVERLWSACQGDEFKVLANSGVSTSRA